jgi:hypothetical protein
MNAITSNRLYTIVPVLALFGCCLVGCSERLAEYQSDEGRFRILMPGTPVPVPAKDLPRPVKAVRLEQRSGNYDVAWEELDLGKGKDNADERLDRACDKAVEAQKGKELARKTIRLGGRYPGRELLSESADGKRLVCDRLYLVDGRLYNVIASGQKWWVESGTTRRVLDSFVLVEE